MYEYAKQCIDCLKYDTCKYCKEQLCAGTNIEDTVHNCKYFVSIDTVRHNKVKLNPPEISFLADIKKVHYGKWIRKEHEDPRGNFHLYHCSECDCPNANQRFYCPECGSKMVR